MASGDTRSGLDDLLDQLEAIEEACPHSSLAIYAPRPEHEHLFNRLCQVFLEASRQERRLIRDAVAHKKGMLNCLLGVVHESIQRVRATGSKRWLQIGLAAAAMERGGNDYRDFLLALADLYVTAEEAGIDPASEFEAIGSGIPADFHRYAVVRSRRERPE